MSSDVSGDQAPSSSLATGWGELRRDCVFIPPRAWHSLHTTSEEPLRFFFVLAADSLEDVDYEFWDGGA